MRNALRLLLVAATLTACSSAPDSEPAPPPVLEPAACGAIAPLHSFGGIYLAGQPSAEDLEAAQRAGVKTVVTLRKDGELDWNEQQVVDDLGMTYVSLPYGSPDELTDEVFDAGRELLDTVERPMMLHCHSANRVGALWLPWRVLDGGASVEEATAEAKEVGLRSPALLAKALDYVARRQSQAQ